MNVLRSRYKNLKHTWHENTQALKDLPKFGRIIWKTSPLLATIAIFLRLLRAFLPIVALYVGKLITDEVVLLMQNKTTTNQLFYWILAEFLIAFLIEITGRGIGLAEALLGDLFANQSSIDIMRHTGRLDLAQLEDAQFYDKLERARRQTIGRVTLMGQVLAQLQDFVTIIFLIISLIFFEASLIFWVLVAVLPNFFSETYFNSYSYSLSKSRTPQRRELDYIRYIGASDETAKEIKIFNLSDFLVNRFAQISQDYYRANRSLAIKRAIAGGFFAIIANAGYYVAYIRIVYQTIQGQLSLGDLTFLVGSFRNLSSSLQNTLSRLASIAQNSLYLQDLFTFFETLPNITSASQALPIPSPIKQGFVFQNVGFRYPNSEVWAVKNLSFELKAGEKLALVGENGAGKTTLVKLLARLYECTEGQILLDGVDLRQYDLVQLRAMISVVFQDYVRFQMTAKENIAVGNINLQHSEQSIVQAAQKSLADSLIAQLPKQYDQMLGKKFAEGIELSGGQWQKIALARAYMPNAQLIILDEPTAALDARAEFEVFQRFTEITQGKTAIIISHRFSTVRMADKILVLKQGQLHEWGTHTELLAQQGLYAELFNLQAKGYQ